MPRSTGMGAKSFGYRTGSFTPLTASMYYIFVSVLLTSCNKLLFQHSVSESFSALLVLAQAITSLCFLLALLCTGALSLPQFWQWSLNNWILYCVFIAAYVGVLCSSLWALSVTTLLMCNTLRRTGILFVVVGEAVSSFKVPARHTLLATILTVVGALVAARGDLQYDVRSYVIVGIANVFSSVYLVLLPIARRKLCLSNLQIQFSCQLGAVPALLLLLANLPASAAVMYPSGPSFTILFAISCVLAAVIANATVVNTTVNTPVAQCVAAQVKDLIIFIVSYYYVDNEKSRGKGNTLGVCISLCGSIVYALGSMHTSKSRHTDDKVD